MTRIGAPSQPQSIALRVRSPEEKEANPMLADSYTYQECLDNSKKNTERRKASW